MKRSILLITALCALLVIAAPLAAQGDGPVGSTVKIVTSDQVVLVGTLYQSGEQAQPGALLLHMMGRSRSDFQALARELGARGIACLAIDLRGHGESTQRIGEHPAELDYRRFTNDDFAGMLLDVRAARSFMTEHPMIQGNAVMIVGASIGANAALVYTAQHGGVRGLALLSPGLDYRGLTTQGAVTELRDCRLLLAAAQDDEYSARTVQRLKESAQVDAELLLYPAGGHGTRLLQNRPELFARLVEFITRTLQ
ncbi:MAG: alpha/beta fold hydrolase [Candidatus Alcyoniella australis]|nr:alpha/beta fold hydrolase [Candidatus Alcyoniella australis]